MSINVTEGRLRWLRILNRIKLRRLFPLLAEIRKTSLDLYLKEDGEFHGYTIMLHVIK